MKQIVFFLNMVVQSPSNMVGLVSKLAVSTSFLQSTSKSFFGEVPQFETSFAMLC